MNLRLDNVLSDISGVTGMAILKAILNGERDPEKLAMYRDKRCKKSQEEIVDSLNGFYREDQLFALDRAVGQYEFHLYYKTLLTGKPFEEPGAKAYHQL